MRNLIKNALSHKKNKIFLKTFYSRNVTVPKLKSKSFFLVHCGHYWKKLFKLNLYAGRKVGAFTFTKKNYQYMPKKKK